MALLESPLIIHPADIIPLTDIDTLRSRFPGYPKLMGITKLMQLGLPVLAGYVVTEMTPEVLDFASAWARSEGSNIRSIRFDSTNPEDNRRLSFANLTLDQLPNIAEHIKHPVIGILLAENNRYTQGHSVTLSFDHEHIIIEAVGPGFDAADLTRGQVSPHERIVIGRPHGSATVYRGECEAIDMAIDIEAHSFTSRGEYRTGRDNRYAKIWSIWRNKAGQAGQVRRLRRFQYRQVERFLKSHGNDIPDQYIPLGYDRISELYTLATNLALLYPVYTGQNITGKTLAASYLERHGLVCWDIYDQHKYGQVQNNQRAPDSNYTGD